MIKFTSLRVRFCLWTLAILIPLGVTLTVMSFWILDTSSGNFDKAINDAMYEMHRTMEIQRKVLELGRDLDGYITHHPQQDGYKHLLAQAHDISTSLAALARISTLMPEQVAVMTHAASRWALLRQMLLNHDADGGRADDPGSVLAHHKELEGYVNEVLLLLDQVHKTTTREISEAGRNASRFEQDARVAVLLTLVAGGLFALAIAVYFSRTILWSIRSLSQGVQEYARGNLDHRIAVHGQDELSLLGTTFNNMAENLQRTHEEYKRISCHDYLTGILNRREIHNILSDEIKRSRRYSRPMSVLLFDLDNFKGVNDRWGHAVGDQVLVAISRLIEKALRPADIFGRYGGEEFVVLLPETDHVCALDTAERLRALIEQEVIEVNGQDCLHATSSFGVSSYPEHAVTEDELIKMADYALYKAKGKGRNRVVGADAIYRKSQREFGILRPQGHVPHDMSILL